MMMTDAMANPMMLGVLWGLVIWVGGAILRLGCRAEQSQRRHVVRGRARALTAPGPLVALAVISQGE